MPRHSPILQILVYFYSKQEKCNIYSYIFIYILKPRHQKKEEKKKKRKQYTHCHFGIQRKFRSKPGKKNTCLKHTYTQILFLPLYLYQYCKLILRQSALNSFFSFCISWFLSSLFLDFLFGFCPLLEYSAEGQTLVHVSEEFDIDLYIGLCLYMYICIHIYTNRHINIVLVTPKPKLSIVSFVSI